MTTSRKRQPRPTSSARDSGVTSVEFSLVMSMLIVVFLLMLQFTLRVHAQRLATAAAEEGLAAATAYSGSAASGENTTRSYLARLGPGLTGAEVQVSRGQRTAAVVVTGAAQEFLPFLDVRIQVRVQGPVEVFVEETR